MVHRLVIALALLILPLPAAAQAWQCRVPGEIAVPPMERPDGPVSTARTTGYTLALSWSPGFCRTRQDSRRDALQCSGRMGRFGFVLHGLWPEGEGESPQWCPTRLAPSRETLRRNLCLTPSPELLVHEWAKHGSCIAKSPDGYFAAGRALYGSIGFPDMARLSREPGLTAGRVRQALVAANPSMRGDMFQFKLDDRGWLLEVFVCYRADFMPGRCRGKAKPADDTPVRIWRGL